VYVTTGSELGLISADKLPNPPETPKVEPRLMLQHQFTSTERAFARKVWNKAVKYVYHARWFLDYMARQDREVRIRLWTGASPFPGNHGEGIPKVWFGVHDDNRFGNVRDAVNQIWKKFQQSPWKMKRHDCVVWAAAHVIVAPQIRLCDNFFGDLSANKIPQATRTLVHEMSHHIWIKSPLRQITDRHTAPIPPCNGPCYGPGEAKMLATDYPNHAVANPDNYARFIQGYGSHLPGG
jgi:hypothetical protein